ncbi:hypothetical protein M501DRAFT_1026273 [Patellaria atrata CBS 101060]|uniref:ubiquitinyl hydrolase 1 n=1 Tax=Patellaria atrata CBS 101060 TaxID=1346257 RepID=A0A9P4VQ10_9PEZI|nr:hypothetical protein M501DRAFT_1026273 [Patellaria atrata CBS 101060]
MFDFEDWVAKKMIEWLRSVTPGSIDKAEALADMLENYATFATAHYKCDPVSLSNAYLTIAELWVALDTIATESIPLLLEFSPEVPVELFQHLLLPKLAQMERLQNVEAYLKERKSSALPHNPCIFADPASGTFGVQYFDQSREHQVLRRSILEKAHDNREKKIQEFFQKQSKFEIIRARSYGREHTFLGPAATWHVPEQCKKCVERREFESMKIAIFEEPLPADEHKAKFIVFELLLPTTFVCWRNSTWLVIQDLARNESVIGEPCIQTLSNQRELPFQENSSARTRISLGTSKKPFMVAHWRYEKFSDASVESIIRPLGADYKFLDLKNLDKNRPQWVAGQKKDLSFQPKCTLTLPSGSFEQFQWAVNSPLEPANRAISEQGACPHDLDLNLQYAFLSLRSGERLQWLNMARELSSSNLIYTEPVVVLFTQASLQTGTEHKSSARRESHFLFEDASFCYALLDAVSRRKLLSEGNWSEHHCISILIDICLRTLSLSPSKEIVRLALDYLRDLRSSTMEWCRDLYKRIGEDESQSKFQTMLFKAAALCQHTVDVDGKFLDDVFADETTIAIFIETAILIHLSGEHITTRTQRISHTVSPKLESAICKNTISDGMSQALSRFIPSLSIVEPWRPVSFDNRKGWVTTLTQSMSNRNKQRIHFHLLTGEFYVEGIEFGQLPTLYGDSHLVGRLFHKSKLSACPSDMTGMKYMHPHPIEGHKVHFGLDHGTLFIRAEKCTQILELIDDRRLSYNLPKSFTKGYFHWIDIETKTIHLRLLQSPWDDTPWSLTLEDEKYVLTSGTKILLNPKSDIASDLCEIFSNIEEKKLINVYTNAQGRLEVELPRYDLNFFINSNGELESPEYGSVVASSQTLPTLHGVESKLILQESNNRNQGGKTLVLVPYGDVETSISKEPSDHTLVTIHNKDALKVRYFVFQVDTNLCKLQTPPELLAALFLIYLHAVSSSALPDKLTGLTGVEEALRRLGESSLRPCSPLGSEEMKILELIAQLTPKREFYPRDMTVQEKVEWNKSIPKFNQHEGFVFAVRGIIASNEYLITLTSSRVDAIQPNHQGDELLLLKAHAQNRRFRSNLPASDANEENLDRLYKSRDSGINPDAQRCYNISNIISEWPKSLNVDTNLLQTMMTWTKVSGFGTVFEEHSIVELIEMCLPGNWGSLFELCRHSTPANGVYKLMFTFGTIAFGVPHIEKHLRALIAISISGQFSGDLRLGSGSFDLMAPREPDRNVMETELRRIEILKGSGSISRGTKRQRIDLPQLNAGIDTFIRQLMDRWPTEHIVETPTYMSLSWTPRENSMRWLTNYISDIYRNHKFVDCIQRIQGVLSVMNCPHSQHLLQPPQITSPTLEPSAPYLPAPSLEEVLSNSSHPTSLPSPPSGLRATTLLKRNDTQDSFHDLEDITGELISDKHLTVRNYGKELQKSLNALKVHERPLLPPELPFDTVQLASYQGACLKYVWEVFEIIRAKLEPENDSSIMFREAGIWPKLTPQTLLARLASTQISKLPPAWKPALICYGEALANLQQAERLVRFAATANIVMFNKELENMGPRNWDVGGFPDWLILELENDFRIRPIQVLVAKKMIFQTSNFVTQLNMGEGKSSVIIPMVVSVLANGEQLARVVSLKPLLPQTHRLLSQRLGGLINRRVFAIPFTRTSDVSPALLTRLECLYRESIKERAVHVTLPEYMLSFRLSGREKLQTRPALGGQLIRIDEWLRRNTRDVMDESDEILDPRYQLVYTVGTQQPIDGHAERWTICQDILTQVIFVVRSLVKKKPGSLEVDERPGCFPTLSFLDASIGDRILQGLLQCIAQGRLECFSFNFDSSSKKAILRFIQGQDLSEGDANLINQLVGSDPRQRVVFYTLRGLIGHRVLLFALQKKRWLVEYGLDLKRCLMAVPYRAKSVPSIASEFAHPDCALLLTCLSYYYHGLTNSQIFQCFEQLQKERTGSDVYASWAKSAQGLPARFMNLRSINLGDNITCCRDVFPHLKYNKKVCDYFMDKIVFPKEAKTFHKKLGASSWDIPAPSNGHITTGFSGTNDTRDLLPLSIKQEDIDDNLHTNALVMNYIIREENRTYMLAADEQGRKLSVPDLLQFISEQSPNVCALIDVGAQVLEMQNIEVVQEWLKVVPDAEAALYFDEHDELMVIDRLNISYRFVSSPYRHNLESCLVYFDEVHTRGVDLVMPDGFRAAVTLGPGLVKDKLVQACMRMRKLGGFGHSIMFIGSPEISLGLQKTSKGENLTSEHVLKWCIQETCDRHERILPFWVTQGVEFVRKEIEFTKLLDGREIQEAVRDQNAVEEYSSKIVEQEEKGLEQLYGASDTRSEQIETAIKLYDTEPFIEELRNRWTLEEQIRELDPEVEREQHTERPPKRPITVPAVSNDIVHFVRKGKLPTEATTVVQAFKAITKDICSNLFVTRDFLRTVIARAGEKADNYLRPVHWVLTSRKRSQVIIISPWEANELMGDIRASEYISLHVYAPQITKTMVDFSHLDVLVVGAWSKGNEVSLDTLLALKLYAGALYLKDSAEYERLLYFLGIDPQTLLFVPPDSRPKKREWKKSPFSSSPLPFLKGWIGHRMRGQSFARTHMGNVIEGKRLWEREF